MFGLKVKCHNIVVRGVEPRPLRCNWDGKHECFDKEERQVVFFCEVCIVGKDLARYTRVKFHPHGLSDDEVF